MTLATSSADFITSSTRLDAARNAIGVTQPVPDADTLAAMVKAGNAIVVNADPDGCLLAQRDPEGQWWVTHVAGSRSTPSVWTTLFKGVLAEWKARGLTKETVRSTKNSSVAVFAAQSAGGVDKGTYYEFVVSTAATKLKVGP